MARIPDAEIERLKSEVSLVRLMEAAGIELKRSGKDWACRCPFHSDDNEPSLIVSVGKNLFHCFACGAAGSPIDWVMKKNGVSFRHAVELLREGLSAVVPGAVAVKHSTVRKLDAPLALEADDQQLLNQVIDYYHGCLKQSPEALAYLTSRGLDHPDMIDTFKLGYANRTLGLRLPAKTRMAGADIRTRLQRIGIYRESGHEHFNGSLIVPVLNESGDVTEIYGRKLRDDLRPGTPLHLYLPARARMPEVEQRMEQLPRPHRGVWNVQVLQSSKEIILCESLIDALTFWCAGYRNVTTSYGVEGFTDEHLAAFKQYGIERVLIAYDRDNAGDAAADKLATRLMAEGIECFRILFPKGMDANAFALQMPPAAKSLGVVIRKAQWLARGQKTEASGQTIPIATAITPMSCSESPQIVEEDGLPFLAADDEEEELKTSVMPHVLDEPLPASPLPVTAAEVPMEVSEREVVMVLGERRYRVRGLPKNLAYDTLKVNLLVSKQDRFYVDTLDLYAARARASYTTQAAVELGVAEPVIKADLGQVLLQLEALQEKTIQQTLTPEPKHPALTIEQEAAALALLRDPNLIERIVHDVAAVGVVGEDSNALVGYLACVSRKLDKPLAVLIQSTSAAGKSTLMEALLSLMPEHERVHYSAMTGQSLFYLGEGDLKHKILAIAEEEGVRQAAYALKLLQSQGELTMASTGKDPQTGKLVTEEYRVEGPVMLLLTTTAIDLDEELLNRCLVLTINESREQTAAIHVRQRSARTLQGLVAGKEAAAIRAVHQAAQTLLRPMAVINPYAEALTFRSESTRMRRDHAKYLTLIDAIAFLHQHQRTVKTLAGAGSVTAYVEVTLADIALANRLAGELLGRSLDELPPQTRRVLGLIVALVESRQREQALARESVRFTRRELRAVAGITDTALRLHVERLVELEYLLAHRGSQGQRFVYELVFDGDLSAHTPQMMGLLDVETLRRDAQERLLKNKNVDVHTTNNFAPQNADFTPPSVNFTPTSHPENTPVAPTSQGHEIPRSASIDAGASILAASSAETALIEAVRKAVLHRSRTPSAATRAG